MNKFTPILMCCVLLSGCASQWVKTRGNAEEYTTARASCETQAEQKYPVRNEVAQRTKYTTYYETCGKKEDCGGEKTKAVKRPEIESYVMDVNHDSRDSLFYQCMELKGWESKLQWY
ncbi:hypothetical protein RI049_05580 [Cedecea neteri]|uniref:hypothetical protein n=1 Tax=Cedecea neteri TaxID=158822 RepID=UPI0005D9F78A|nr:hypothetical protein [Cedecea neteri]AJZ90544.1 hypothetical protein VW41_16690 [Klebsiella michiganensis]WPU24226.1 hypothetical protein RI049_05580 [Cedecea neteri]